MRNSIPSPLILVAIILITFFVVTSASAQPGSLDPTFGTGGKLIDAFVRGGGNDSGNSVLLQGDGRIVTVGQSSYGNKQVCSATRHLADGSLDPTFGNGGKVLMEPTFPM